MRRVRASARSDRGGGGSRGSLLTGAVEDRTDFASAAGPARGGIAVVVIPDKTSSAADAHMLSAIAAACRNNETLRFQYRDHAGKPTSRATEPHRMVHTGRRWYLAAWGTRIWRTFRVDRIQRPVTGLRFNPREPPVRDLAEYVVQGVWQAPRCRARIKLLVETETPARGLSPGAGLIEPIDERSCYLEGATSTYEALAIHFVFLGFDFEVTEPTELIQEVRRLEERFRRATLRKYISGQAGSRAG